MSRMLWCVPLRLPPRLVPSACQEHFLSHVSAETLLVGHALENDLRALRTCHARVLDSALLFPHPKGAPHRSALKVSGQWQGLMPTRRMYATATTGAPHWTPTTCNPFSLLPLGACSPLPQAQHSGGVPRLGCGRAHRHGPGAAQDKAW